MRVLVVGNPRGELGEAAAMARSKGARIECAGTPQQGIALIAGGLHVEIIFCELCEGIIDLIEFLKSQRYDLPVIACGRNDELAGAESAIRAGAREFLPLPPDPLVVAAILEEVDGDLDTPIARDPVMLRILRKAEQVAASDASVLLSGESGTGKEVLARFIHKRSRRMGRPFVAVNCAAIPETMLESELFGHEKGAFSGAAARRIGKFEMASGGTLLLDELTEMDIRIQAKLLRAIQEREVDRLGGTRPIPIDVRIIATSNRNLAEAVRSGILREDLYYRVSVVTIRVPSLKERALDIPVLAEHFAARFARLNGVRVPTFSPEAMQRLVHHSWPGNVRELENAVHRATLLSDDGKIDAEMLELPGLEEWGLAKMGGREGSRLSGRRLEDVERELILNTLEENRGNRTKAAVILGISIRTLRNKLRDYARQGILVPPPAFGGEAA